MSLRAIAWLVIVGSLGSLAAAPAPVAARDQLVEGRIGAEALILSVIDYTRWPAAGEPALLCTTRGGAKGQDVARALKDRPQERRLQVREIEPNRSPPPDCDVVVYEGWSPAAQQQSLRALAERPVLSIGFGTDFCSDGGILCLAAPTTLENHFEVNLDAVARSGLRINPRVLQLARPPRKPA